DIVEFLLAHPELQSALLNEIKQIGDMERLISKIGLQRANPREVVQLKRSLYAIAKIKILLDEVDSEALNLIARRLDGCEELSTLIDQQLDEEPPVLLAKGNVIAEGVNEELDRVRKMALGGKGFLLDNQKREGEATGLPKFKI